MHHRNLDRGLGKPSRDSGRSTPARYVPSSSKRRNTTDERYSLQQPHPQQVNLVSNSYRLETSVNKLMVHEYQLTVTPSEGYKTLPVKVLLKNFVSRSIRKLIMNEIVPKLLEPSVPQGSVVIESNLEAIYSSTIFKMNNESVSSKSNTAPSKNELILYENLLVKTDLLGLLRVDISINYTRQFDMNTSSEHKHNILTSVLHHQLLIDMMRYGSVYYRSQAQHMHDTTRNNRLDLISQHVMGISISGLRRSINDETLVVLNCPHSYITSSHRLIDLLATFIAGRPIKGLKLSHSSKSEMNLMPEIVAARGAEPWFQTFISILEGFKCRADGPEERINLRFNLTDDSATNLTMDATTSLTVREHYEQLGINLNYPNLPCLISRSGRHCYYPLELCSLISGQKVPIFRLSSAARIDMALLNKPKPSLSRQLSCQARDELETTSGKQLKTFGLRLSRDPVEATGSTLPKPTLQYKNRLMEPKRDFWESGVFYEAMHLVRNWCVVNTVPVDSNQEETFFIEFRKYSKQFGFNLDMPFFIYKAKEYLLEHNDSVEILIRECQKMTEGNLRFIMFIIDSSSTPLNRLVHLSFDEHPNITASCLRVESIMNDRQHRSIYRTLVHKLNARLGGTNVSYDYNTLASLSLGCEDLMIIGLDVTHPDNELNGVSIVGCAYTFGKDLFRHRSLVWPQTARVEIITKVDLLMKRVINEYYIENERQLPKQIIVYRDGVSHEEFDKVRANEVSKAQTVLEEIGLESKQAKPVLSYIIAQKRHTMRFFDVTNKNSEVSNPPSGTLIDQDVVSQSGREYYLYSNTSPQATARPLHYHVLLNGLGIENLQKLTYFLCFNFGKCSGTLSMPSSLKYAHNAAYDARNRVIALREFSENKFYTSKFFC